MRSRERKKEAFRKDIEDFENSSRTTEDYMKLIANIHKASGFGDGLVYQELEGEIAKVLKNKRGS